MLIWLIWMDQRIKRVILLALLFTKLLKFTIQKNLKQIQQNQKYLVTEQLSRRNYYLQNLKIKFSNIPGLMWPTREFCAAHKMVWQNQPPKF